MLDFFKKPIFSDFRFIFGVYALAVLYVSLTTVFHDGSNNYSIFYYSLEHLIKGQSLYNTYPAQYSDHYHYAPSFAGLFSPVFALPYNLGLFLWHFLFAAIWVYAIWRMPLTRQQKVFAYWFALQELFTAIGNSQTNPLIAAIPLFAFLAFEKKATFWAAFFIMLGFSIKIYSVVGAALFLLYPQKGRFLVYLVLWGFLLTLPDLLFTSPEKLLWQYDLWVKQLLIKTDHDKWANNSIHILISRFISPNIPTPAVIGLGVLLFCTVYARYKRFAEENYKMLLLASILIFQTIFNPAGESPAYIIAVTGVLLYWFYGPKTRLDLVLLLACFVLTILSPTDIFPPYLRQEIFRPYGVKAMPCVAIWFRVLYLMLLPSSTKATQS
jgi:Glycosyltransferase family 87